jgi:hypothetical protein
MRNLILSILLAITAIGAGFYFYSRIASDTSAPVIGIAHPEGGGPKPQGQFDEVTLYVKIPKALESAFEKRNPAQKFSITFIVNGKSVGAGDDHVDYSPGMIAIILKTRKQVIENATSVRVIGLANNGGVPFSTQLAPLADALKPNSPKGLFAYVLRPIGFTNKSCAPGKEKPTAVSLEMRPTKEMKAALHPERKYFVYILHFERGLNGGSQLTNIGSREMKGTDLSKDSVKTDVPLVANYEKILEGSKGMELFLLVDCSHSKTGSCLEASQSYVWTNEFVLVPKGYVSTQSFCQDETYKFVLAPANSSFGATVDAEMNKLN